ncbi:proline racemase family protein [Pleionea sp. CnH1-48]|uniref:proline racemase family protein n=1 Tax=Pleionea sp. CnH1-48 TaxID=2954494 RepID=UPI00209687C8|nr:proline racemase family protein [Pleionea sp. CnH1-48]MCO7227483.1 proline racemase family protein [Pleionea sp. CnH1-48]
MMDRNKLIEHPFPKQGVRIKTLEYHTGGEPLRIIVDGFPELAGKTILEKRNDCRERFDHLRTALMFEPRGHADMYGCLIVEPERADSHFGVLFLHNEGYSSMCGHAVIAVTKAMVESGAIPMTSPMTEVRIDSPAGQIRAFAHSDNDSVTSVHFENVPSFVYGHYQIANIMAEPIPVTIAYGGAFYAYVNASAVDLTLRPDNHERIISLGRKIKQEVQRTLTIEHPFESDLSFIYGTIFVEPTDNETHSRNACVFADGELDRSPTGTGVSGRAAIHYLENDIELEQPVVIESLLGSRFTVTALKETTFGPHQAIIPRVEGNAHFIGKNEFVVNSDDPLSHGFILR